MNLPDEPPDVRYRVAERCAVRVLAAVAADMPGGPAQRLAAAVYLILESMYEAEITLSEWREEVQS